MLKYPLVLMLLTVSVTGIAQNYTPTDDGSKVHFIIRNFGINTGGDLHGLKGNIVFTSANLKTSVFNVSVEVKTIDTDNGSRDKDLRSDSYFDAGKFPLITIKSTKIDKTNRTDSGWYYFTGMLTIHGVTKIISFPFTTTLKGDDYLFSGKFDINRLDYGVGENSSVMSKTVKVSLSVLAKKI
jgi:polyisoprenoid-binding protein YceI